MLFALLRITPLIKILQSLIKREIKDNQRATDRTIFLKSNKKNCKQEPTSWMNYIPKYWMFQRLNFLESFFGEDDLYIKAFSILTNPPGQNAKNIGKIPNFTKTFPGNSFLRKYQH